ncbi:MAG: 2-oxoacid:acceptor oxidoreductase subunit alpha [Candidatus Pacebacteria bacterium]|nr:2-oxoacid:acceptor oxidoreductase subunit alpha [Candidatus Paceibacterota bacterium]
MSQSQSQIQQPNQVEQSSKPAFNWKIAGEAGHGVMLASQLMAKLAKRHAMSAFNYLEYPSLIRGGHQTGQVYADFDNVSCQHRDLDVIVIYTPAGFEVHQDEITSDTIIIYNSDFGPLDKAVEERYQGQITQMPLSTWAKETAGTGLAANVVSLGVSSYLLGLSQELGLNLIQDTFKGNQKLIQANEAAYIQGFNQAKQAELNPLFQIKPAKDNQILLNGNEAIGMGLLAAGLQFYSAYPMTPATGLLHFMNEHKDHYSLVVKQVEDEIGAINEAIGAAVAGVRAATGSSGGGFALMTEAVSFAGVAEIPLVILEAQRTGPASGVPTWTAQADLQFVLTAGHGDFPKVVLTPGTVEEHFDLAQKAVYLAEKYQLPVIILSDKFILESHQTMSQPESRHKLERYSQLEQSELPEDDSYLRYKLTDSGISPRSLPGQKHGLHLANSYEHDQWGYATEDSEPIKAQVDKRDRKMQLVVKEVPEPVLYGPKQAEVTFIGWGSTINVLQEVIKLMQEQGLEGKVNAIHLPCFKPLPVSALKKLTTQAQKLVMVEGNSNGQAENWLKQQAGIQMDDSLRRYDGRPFYAEDLVEYLCG